MNPEKALTTEKPAGAAPPRLVRKWWGTDYPVIARLDEKCDLIAHPNGPAITDGDTLSVIDTHPDDCREKMLMKMKAQAAWREYSWPLLREGFYPTNVNVDLPDTAAQDSASKSNNPAVSG